MDLLNEIIIFLIAAVLAVPLAKKLGLGSILGYLGAGIVIGPAGLSLVTNVDNILHISELGVVLLLFVIGLELQPSRLHVLRKSMLQLGLPQVLFSTIFISAITLLLGLGWQQALIIGCCLALSSTAFALQLLSENGQLLTQHGRNAFGVLLFQDLIVVPMLALLPLLAAKSNIVLDSGQLQEIGISIVSIIGTIIGGHFLLRPVLHMVAVTRNTELFSAASLLVVLGIAMLMAKAGLSMALGAFLAGALLANSEFRHELEANIQPFKGLLLGLFFMSVGMLVNLTLITTQPFTLLGLAVLLVAIKIAILFGIAYWQKQETDTAIRLAITLSQGGEFAFVLLHSAISQQIVSENLSDMVVMVVILSMGMTPLLIKAYNYLYRKQEGKPAEYDAIDDNNPKIIIAGFGRFGQIIARVLQIKKIPFTALEANFEQVAFVRKFGNKIYFGDATRLDLLRAAHIESAQVMILAIVDMETSIKVAELVKQHFPHIRIFARARNRAHVYQLLDAGVDYVIRETFLSSLELAKRTLNELGIENTEAESIVATFREYDEELLRKQYQVRHSEDQVIASAKAAALELQSLFEEDSQAERKNRGQNKNLQEKN